MRLILWNWMQGVVGNGRFRSIPVSASISPIRLAPDGFAQWLTCTPDANCADAYVIRKSGRTGPRPHRHL
ncbi:MAG: hypothetical protein M5U34_05160 [Chloroflexi bacterium]|nr:hypothetical protein [Chloroflexota bacterium]